MVTMVGYEATLLAARELVEAGPFWLLDLWDSFSPALQREVIETLVGRKSFTQALARVGFVDDLAKLGVGLADDLDGPVDRQKGNRAAKVVNLAQVRARRDGQP